jgi:hypothetical protein
VEASALLDLLERDRQFEIVQRDAMQQVLAQQNDLIEPLLSAAREIANAFPDASGVELAPTAHGAGCELLIHLPQLPCIEERRQLLDDFALRWWNAAAQSSLPARRLSFDIG